MDNSHIEDLLDESQILFERSGTEFEEGLDVDDPTLLQLRKACRLIDAAQFLEQEDGYYTVIIEASFAAIERSIQFYLLDTGLLHEDEYINHEEVYQRGEDAGLYSREFAGEPPRGQAPRLPVSMTRLAGTDEDRPPSASTAAAVSTGVTSACPRPTS